MPVSEARLLRLFRFRPTGSGSAFDAAFRQSFRGFCARPGLLSGFAGRHGAGDPGDRIVVSAWDSAEAGAGPFEIEAICGIEAVAIEALPIRMAVISPAPRDVIAILRVFRGTTRPGELEAYAEDVRQGVGADIAAGHGPIALFLATTGPDAFVTVSTWRSWDAIEAATGGNVRQPVATRQTGRLLSGVVQHYELLPEATSAREPLALAD